MIISLCGFMGAGKSTVGKYLAKMLGFAFIDLDSYIEQKLQMSVAEFFAAYGEPAFRKEELCSLKEVLGRYAEDICTTDNADANKDGNNSEGSVNLSGKGLVLSLGGGTVIQQECAELVKEKTFCIYLYCSKEELVKRLKRNIAKRPVLQGKTDKELENHIENLMNQREGIYKSCANATINTASGNLQQVIDNILKVI